MSGRKSEARRAKLSQGYFHCNKRMFFVLICKGLFCYVPDPRKKRKTRNNDPKKKKIIKNTAQLLASIESITEKRGSIFKCCFNRIDSI